MASAPTSSTFRTSKRSMTPHASQIATGLPVLTAHVVVDDQCFYDGRPAP